MCGFQKPYYNTHALLLAWQKELDKSGFMGIFLMDLPKV